MSLYIYEVREEGERNIKSSPFPADKKIGREQLRNYAVALTLGADDYDSWD